MLYVAKCKLLPKRLQEASRLRQQLPKALMASSCDGLAPTRYYLKQPSQSLVMSPPLKRPNAVYMLSYISQHY